MIRQGVETVWACERDLESNVNATRVVLRGKTLRGLPYRDSQRSVVSGEMGANISIFNALARPCDTPNLKPNLSIIRIHNFDAAIFRAQCQVAAF
jgi:hypothetical protein